MNKVNQVRMTSPFISGLLYSFVFLLISTVLTSVIIAVTSLQENLSAYIYIIHGISLSIGGYISGKRAGNKGWYYGGITGLIYSAIVILVGFLGFDAALDTQSAALATGSFATAALGGIFGVNAKR